MVKFKQFKQIGFNLLLGLGGISFALVITEIALRILGISYPSFYQVDEYRGHALIPGISGWWTHEGKGWVEVNRDGLRDKEYTKNKPENTLRIAILGDSFAEAIQVNQAETFWSLIEQQLPNCKRVNEQQVEVINFGVGDYGTAQELMTLKHRVWDYSPDLVILAIFTGNDIINNSKVLSPDDRFSPFLIEQKGEFIMDLSFLETETYQWRNSLQRKVIFSIVNNSRLLQLINEARIAFKNRRNLLGVQQQNNQPTEIVKYLDLTPELYLKDSNKDWQQAWTITEELVKLINQEIQQKKARFLAVTLSNPAQVYPDASERQKYLTQVGITNEFYPEQRLNKLGEKEGFEVFNLAPQFQDYADQNNVHLHGFENTVLGSGHWNQAGHKLAGELITKKICKIL
ncbi:MAG TPA: G-D-S-L family lipolytic protein [Cyanothece sp. UBA12306]|nr:G-D-S-L family lipolytic protein [Cyanothece sp. UBA12306]